MMKFSNYVSSRKTHILSINNEKNVLIRYLNQMSVVQKRT